MLFREGNIEGGDGHRRLRKRGVQDKFSFSLRTTGSFAKSGTTGEQEEKWKVWCGRLNMAFLLSNARVLISGISECVTLHGDEELKLSVELRLLISWS